MTQPRRPGFRLSTVADGDDRFTDPGQVAGVPVRRSIAFFIDMLVVGVIYVVAFIPLMLFNVVTFGLFSGLTGFLWFLGPYIYAVAGILLPGAGTVGMRAMGVDLRGLDGQPPEPLQAILHVGLFWITVPATAGLILLVSLLNPRGRTLHDYLSGLILLPADAVAAEPGPGGRSRFSGSRTADGSSPGGGGRDTGAGTGREITRP